MAESVNFLDVGVGDGVKGAIHGSLMTFSAMCLLYNLGVAAKRGKPKHWLNVAVYTFLLGYEAWNVKEHL